MSIEDNSHMAIHLNKAASLSLISLMAYYVEHNERPRASRHARAIKLSFGQQKQ
jgi:hypothetical protein